MPSDLGAVAFWFRKDTTGVDSTSGGDHDGGDNDEHYDGGETIVSFSEAGVLKLSGSKVKPVRRYRSGHSNLRLSVSSDRRLQVMIHDTSAKELCSARAPPVRKLFEGGWVHIAVRLCRLNTSG